MFDFLAALFDAFFGNDSGSGAASASSDDWSSLQRTRDDETFDRYMQWVRRNDQ